MAKSYQSKSIMLAGGLNAQKGSASRPVGKTPKAITGVKPVGSKTSRIETLTFGNAKLAPQNGR